MIQGGGVSSALVSVRSLTPADFTKRNGAGGESIYGGTFPDEDLTRPLDAEGRVHTLSRPLVTLIR